MREPRPLTIAWMYPDTLSTYGDRGNVLALAQRARWRGLDTQVVRVGERDEVPDDIDVFVLGGGQDGAQTLAAAALRGAHGDRLREQVDQGAAVLAICAGYQLLCHEYRTAAGELLPGLGLFDAVTVAGTGRLIGEVRLETTLGPVFGFENHGGRTYLGTDTLPFGRVVSGHGNNGRDGTEGAWRDRLLGSYLHGPLLPGNPAVTDWLLGQALERRGGGRLLQLSDTYESAVRSRRFSVV